MAKLKGTKKNDKLKGTKKADVIEGLGGDDEILGLKGKDRLKGGAGNDILDGGKGNDILKGGAGDDLMIAGEGKNKFFGGKGIDTVTYEMAKGAIVASLLSGKGAKGDRYKGVENIDGSAFADTIIGNAKANRLRGLDGNDHLVGGGGNDILEGGDGDDVLDGGDGDDLLIGGGGKNAFIGGAGIDTVTYAFSGSHKPRGVIAPGSIGTAGGQGVDVDLSTGKGARGAAGHSYSGIENVDGTDFDDTLIGNNAANVLRGGKGMDTLYGGSGNDTLYGGDGDDIMVGGPGADAFYGGAHGGGVVGFGGDMVSYIAETAGVIVNFATGKGGGAAAGDTYSGIEGLLGTNFADTFTGAGADEFFFGGGGNDTAYGGGGDDRLYGHTGSDKLYGGQGDDRLSPGADNAPDQIFGGAGNDWVDYGDASAGITVNLTDNASSGGAAGDTYHSVENVQGGDGDDFLKPAPGGRAYGGAGNDIIVDSTGTEVLRGGAGNDVLSDAVKEDGLRDIFFLDNGTGFDTVMGFDQGTDLFWLSNGKATGLAAGNRGNFAGLKINSKGELAAGRVVNDSDGNGVGDATQGYAQLIFDTVTRTLWYDADGTGSGQAKKIAVIDGFDGTLKTSDFLVVPDI